MEFNFKSYNNSKQSISYCEVDKCKAVVDLKQQLDQLKEQLEAYKMEAEEGKEINAELKAENKTLKQTLTEIKEIAIKHNLCDECSGFDDCERYCPENACSTYQMQFILQICDEVNDER